MILKIIFAFPDDETQAVTVNKSGFHFYAAQ